MKIIGTSIIKFAIIGMIFSMVHFGYANAQDIPETEDPGMLETMPFSFNMDMDDVDWAEDFTFFPFEGAALIRVENPDASGLNESDYVLSYEKSSGAEPWAGFFYHVDEIEITDESVFRLKVWSPRADFDAIMKLEMQEADVETEDLLAEVTESEEWIELEWDLSGVQEAPYDVVTIIFDLDMDNPPSGGESDTWFLDDFELEGVGEVTSSERVEAGVPQNVKLEQNYPNPFNPVTTIEFAIPEASHVTLEVFNMLGQRVETLKDERLSQGQHSVTFDASDLTSGTYIYRLQAGDQVLSRNLTLIR